MARDKFGNEVEIISHNYNTGEYEVQYQTGAKDTFAEYELDFEEDAE